MRAACKSGGSTRYLLATRARLGVSLVSFLLLAGAALAARSETFSGELQRVTTESISIRLADGRIVESRNIAAQGDLSSRNLAKKYTVGDRVEITCVAINGIYSQLLGRRLDLDLTKLKLLRNPTRQERAAALTSKAWRQSPNLLRLADPESSNAVPVSEWPASLAGTRSHIAKFLSEMPNFVADEVAKRYVSTAIPPDWQLADTIESEITFKGGAVSREHIAVNGKPWNSGYRELPGFKWTDAFGSQLTYLLNRHCPTTFEAPGKVNEEGKSLSAIRYSSPADGCEFYWQDHQQFYPAKTGRILLDEGEENVIRLETDSPVFPAAFPISSVEKKVTWDFVKIGDDTHLLPVYAEITIVLSTGEMRWSKHEYRNHRHFEAGSNVTFH
jgi:hypothetical protein